MTFCENCGASLKENARFCGVCGSQIEALPQTPAPEPERIRAGSVLAIWFSIVYTLASLSSIILVGIVIEAGSHISSSEEEAILISLAVSIVLLIPAAVMFFVWLYQTWSAVPPQYRSTTPGKAVGLFFVPLFNLYWQFRAVVGLSRSIERSLSAGAPLERRGAGCALAIASCVISLVPYVNIIAFILDVIWVNVANAAKNRMLRRMAGAGPRG